MIDLISELCERIIFGSLKYTAPVWTFITEKRTLDKCNKVPAAFQDGFP